MTDGRAMFRAGINEAASRPGRALHRRLLAAIAASALVLPAYGQTHNHGAGTPQATTAATAVPAGTESPANPAATVDYHSATIFTLKTGIADGRMVYLGVGGKIDGMVNPTLVVHEGEVVQINLINGEGAQHDMVLDQYAARSAVVVGKNASSTFSFVASKVGDFAYFCSIADHRAAGDGL